MWGTLSRQRKTLAVEKTDKEAFKVEGKKKLEDNEVTTAGEMVENQRKDKEDVVIEKEEDNVAYIRW